MNKIILFNKFPCPVLKFEEPDSYLILFKGEFKWIYETSLGYGEIIEKGNGKNYEISGYYLHREKGPAIIHYDGSRYWYQNDRLHRTDGPAYEYCNGTIYWFIKGIEYSEEEYLEILKNK